MMPGSLFPLCVMHMKMQVRWQLLVMNHKWPGEAVRYLSSQSVPGMKSTAKPLVSDMNRIRNVGIIAHIDAGKTTTTERFLYYSGLTSEMGEVHDGDTVTDYMEQERERGITITSAAVTFPWNKHRINLIDTPGHVDFTVEVERSLSVLDSALVVLDAGAGVEAQTVTVWSQADRHNVPRIVYLNKMDKQNADVDLCLKSIRRLGSEPLMLHHAIKKSAKDFIGIVDLVTMEKMMWDNSSKDCDGSDFKVDPLSEKDDLYEECLRNRESMIAQLADEDESVAESLLSHDDVSQIPLNILKDAVRRLTINRTFIPVLCGSSFRKVAVHPLMDAIIDLLPSPLDVVKRNTSYFAGFFCGLAFKVMHHKQMGSLTFVRVYSGELKPGTRIYNVNRNRQESVSRIYVALADQFKEVPYITAGNIVVVSGLECVTGDTLVTSASILQEVSDMTSFSLSLVYPPQFV